MAPGRILRRWPGFLEQPTLLLDVRGVDNKLETVTLTEISGSPLIPYVLWSSGPADICGFCERHRLGVGLPIWGSESCLVSILRRQLVEPRCEKGSVPNFTKMFN